MHFGQSTLAIYMNYLSMKVGGGGGSPQLLYCQKSSKYDPSLLFFLLLVCAYRKLGVFTPQQKVTAKNFHFEVQSKKGL